MVNPDASWFTEEQSPNEWRGHGAHSNATILLPDADQVPDADPEPPVAGVRFQVLEPRSLEPIAGCLQQWANPKVPRAIGEESP
jgi:hypothetical protein